MRISRFHFQTMKEDPSDAEVISHKLMLRAGLIRRLGSGLYTWMPLGLRILRKVEAPARPLPATCLPVELVVGATSAPPSSA